MSLSISYRLSSRGKEPVKGEVHIQIAYEEVEVEV